MYNEKSKRALRLKHQIKPCAPMRYYKTNKVNAKRQLIEMRKVQRHHKAPFYMRA